MDLNWNKSTPRVWLTAEDDDFDQSTIQHWADEGFEVFYLAYDKHKKKEYRDQLSHIPDKLGFGEKFAIVAYGDAAAIVLDVCIKPMSKLCAIVAYYPTQYPKTSTTYGPNTECIVHAAGSERVPLKCRSYNYPFVEIGFAEADLETYDKISASLAWSRSLGAVRRGFRIDVDLESIWENHMALEFATKDADATMKTMVPQPYVNHIPTLTGGIGFKDLHRFYTNFFIPCNPPSLVMKLLSRTEGIDRIVDEFVISFTHSCEIPWLLPGVKPTEKYVEVAMVSVVRIRGEKLEHEHIYWDQASVLVQVGLLDPMLIPESMKGKAKRLPVVGVESARKVMNEKGPESNHLIEEWRGAGGKPTDDE